MTINDLPEKAQEELREILRKDILEDYHSGKLAEDLKENEKVEKGLTDGEVLMLYNNASCWKQQIIEEYIIRWKATGKTLKESEQEE